VGTRQVKWEYPSIVISLGILYFVGEMLQLSLIGPNWLRWHLSGLGFPLATAWIFALITSRKYHPAIYIIAGGVLAVICELAFDYSIGQGDPIDMLCYLASTVFGSILSIGAKTEN
jgi:hypothetical protein